MIDEVLTNLEKKPDQQLLENHLGDCLTRKQFLEKVEVYYSQLDKIKISDVTLYLLLEEEPLKFYPLVFALLKKGYPLVFPTKNFISKASTFKSAKYIIKLSDENIIFELNDGFIDSHISRNTELVVFSSGSTGDPKGVVHKFENFLRNAEEVNEVLNIEKYSSITFLKPYLVSGFSHFLVHLLSYSKLTFLDFNNLSILNKLYKENKSLSVVGSPMHLSAVFNNIPEYAAPQFLFSSGDFLHYGIIEKFLARWSNLTIFKVYGLAELAGRFFINPITSEKSEAEIGLIGEALPGCNFIVTEGEICVKSNYLFLGYQNKEGFESAEDLHQTGDIISDDITGIRLVGRKSDEFKVAGNKVYIKDLERKLSSVLHLNVVIILSEHELFGHLINLIIEKNPLSRKEIIQKIKTVVHNYEIPHYFYDVDIFPIGKSAKIDRTFLKSKISQLSEIL